MPLQHFDLVPVRVLNEEKARKQGTIPLELDNLSGGVAGGFKPGMLAIKVIDTKSHVPITLTKVIWVSPTLIDGEFDFEVG